jgi:hypothetical protein
MSIPTVKLDSSVITCTAEKQQGAGGFCQDDLSCKNNLYCLNSTCTAAYSQTNGTYIGAGGHLNLCESREVTDKPARRCIIRNYVDKPDDKTKLVKCDLGQQCNYTTGLYDEEGSPLPWVSSPCLCSFSKTPESFCPVPYSISKYIFFNFFRHK